MSLHTWINRDSLIFCNRRQKSLVFLVILSVHFHILRPSHIFEPWVNHMNTHTLSNLKSFVCSTHSIFSPCFPIPLILLLDSQFHVLYDFIISIQGGFDDEVLFTTLDIFFNIYFL